MLIRKGKKYNKLSLCLLIKPDLQQSDIKTFAVSSTYQNNTFISLSRTPLKAY